MTGDQTSVFPQPTDLSGAGRGGPDIMAQAGGLTKRELFAAMCLQGLLASDETWSETAEKAVAQADALIAALDNKEAKTLRELEEALLLADRTLDRAEKYREVLEAIRVLPLDEASNNVFRQMATEALEI